VRQKVAISFFFCLWQKKTSRKMNHLEPYYIYKLSIPLVFHPIIYFIMKQLSCQQGQYCKRPDKRTKYI